MYGVNECNVPACNVPVCNVAVCDVAVCEVAVRETQSIGDSGTEFGLNALRDVTHIGASLELRLQFTHQLSHCGHASRLDTRQRLIDQRIDIGS